MPHRAQPKSKIGNVRFEPVRCRLQRPELVRLGSEGGRVGRTLGQRLDNPIALVAILGHLADDAADHFAIEKEIEAAWGKPLKSICHRVPRINATPSGIS